MNIIVISTLLVSMKFYVVYISCHSAPFLSVPFLSESVINCLRGSDFGQMGSLIVRAVQILARCGH